MARVAYVMDGVMGRIGLSGRAFIPMILGFGCSVPAIMASRALEDPKDRMKTMLVTPFMSCSARLPIYILFSQMFFGSHAMLAAYSMYVIGLVVAMLFAFYDVAPLAAWLQLPYLLWLTFAAYLSFGVLLLNV